MPETDVGQLTTTLLKSGVPDFKVSPKTIDEAGIQPETFWENPNWSTYLGYLKTIPEYRNAVRALAIWACGKGWECPLNEHTVILERIRGWGEDSFDSIVQDMIVVKKTNGDAYLEIIRNDNGTLLNLKKLNPSKIRIAVNPKGLIVGYDIMQANGKWERMKTEEIFHICNDRIANEIHGTSVLSSCKWVIDAKNEAMNDWRRISHLSSIRVLYIDIDNTERLTKVKTEYAEGIKNGSVMIIPAKKGEAEFQDLVLPPIEAFMRWIEYLDNFFYQVVGVNRTIAGGLDQTEAGQKMGYLTFEPTYTEEQTLLESDLWNQLAIKLKFNRPPSLSGMMRQNETKNSGMLGMQQNETEMKPTQQT